MRKEHVLAILFFACLWGAAEVVLGGFLKSAHVPHYSAPLTVVAFMILTVAKHYLPQRGSATAIASIAMLFKFLNVQFFVCHFLAVLLLGLSYDLCSSLFKIKNRAVFGLTATYTGYILFALLITYVFSYQSWSLERVIRYVGISGTIAAAINLVAVPACHHLGGILKSKTVNPFAFKSGLATGGVTVITVALWFLGIARVI